MTSKPFDARDGSGTPQTDADFAVWGEHWPDSDFGLVCECGAQGEDTLRESVAAGWEQHGWIDYSRVDVPGVLRS